MTEKYINPDYMEDTLSSNPLNGVDLLVDDIVAIFSEKNASKQQTLLFSTLHIADDIRRDIDSSPIDAESFISLKMKLASLIKQLMNGVIIKKNLPYQYEADDNLVKQITERTKFVVARELLNTMIAAVLDEMYKAVDENVDNGDFTHKNLSVYNPELLKNMPAVDLSEVLPFILGKKAFTAIIDHQLNLGLQPEYCYFPEASEAYMQDDESDEYEDRDE